MMASARGPICPRGTPGGSAAGSTAPQPAHTPLYSRYSLTSGRIGGMSNTWCRSGLPRTLTVPPQVHTGGGTQSCTRWTSDSGSRARNAPGWPFCAPRLRALALRCARLPRPGPSEDGGLDELRESSARRSSRMMTLSRSEASSPASASITAWHCSTVAGLLTPTTPRPASPLASLCMRTVSGQNHELTSAISTELADDAAAPRWHSRGGAEYVRRQEPAAAAGGADAARGARAAARVERHDAPRRVAALRHRAAPARRAARARQGYRVLAPRAAGSRRQGRQGPRHRAAREPDPAAAAPARARPGAARPRPRRGIRRGLAARCAGGQVPWRAHAVGLAVGVSGRAALGQSAQRRGSPSSPERGRRAARGGTGRAPRRHRQAVLAARAAPLVRRPSAAGRLRHPHGAGAARPRRRVDDDDLYARARARGARGAQPAGPDLKRARRPALQARPTCTAQYFSSGILAVGSSAGLVSRLAAASWYANAMNTAPSGVPSSARAASVTSPRRERTLIASPGPIPSAARSRGFSVAVGAGSIASSTAARRVIAPVCQCSSWRPVISTNG